MRTEIKNKFASFKIQLSEANSALSKVTVENIDLQK